MRWGIGLEEPSLASTVWLSDMTGIFTAFLRHMEESPLRSRIIGYQIGAGIYGEWHYFASEFMPDCGNLIAQMIGAVPSLDQRIRTTFGLLRDPAKERNVIEFYRRFHENICADTLLHFARLLKALTVRRILCGAFYTYLLENVWIQEGGHLAPEKVLRSDDIDFVASPYAYQTTNIPGRPWWEHDVVDGAGRWLGRARGVAGDGGYRVLLESVKRAGKLYFAEIDPGTFMEPPPINIDGSGGSDVEKELCMIGGVGSTTREGTLRILRRDLGRMFAGGNGGWLFDFGPVMRTGGSWYDDDEIIAEVQRFATLGSRRPYLHLGSAAQVAAVYDAKSFFVTRHWRAEAPFPIGGSSMDFFGLWFLDSQARVFHRLGAPVDFLYRFDLTPDDARRYRLLFMVNLFFLAPEEVTSLRSQLSGSGATVVWYYAPGLVSPSSIDLQQMQHLTGFRFEMDARPGPTMIECVPGSVTSETIRFGIQSDRQPRFSVLDGDVEVFGRWIDSGAPSFASKAQDGWTSVYVGTAPLPPLVLRWLALRAAVHLWSSEPDIVTGTRDAIMLVATSGGSRTILLPRGMTCLETGMSGTDHSAGFEEGEVRIYVKPE